MSAMPPPAGGQPVPPPVDPALGGRVEGIVAAAQKEAADFRRQSDRDATLRAAALLEAAEGDARRARDGAVTEVQAYLAEARRRVDSYAAEQIEEIRRISQGLIQQSDDLRERFDVAEKTRRQIQVLVAKLGETADHLAELGENAGPLLPQAPAQIPAQASRGALLGDVALSMPAPPPAPVLPSADFVAGDVTTIEEPDEELEPEAIPDALKGVARLPTLTPPSDDGASDADDDLTREDQTA